MRVKLFPAFFLACLFSSLFCFSETINFRLPVGGFKVKEPEHFELPVEWNEKWFGEKPSTVYNHDLARAACFFSYAAYADVKNNPSGNELYEAYRKIGIKDEDVEAHYDLDYSDAVWGDDQCAFTICSKKIQSSKGVRTLIFVNLRGTPFNSSEWISNLSVSDAEKIQTTMHKGFAKAAHIVNIALISYLLRHTIDPTNAFLFMTGHSRGAAVANVLSSLILRYDFFKRENIYTYTFACPNVSSSPHTDDEKYHFIWNIVNAEDIVPTVPLNRGNWGYKKFGHVLAFSNKTNVSEKKFDESYLPKINNFYTKISGHDYHAFTTGPFLPIITTKLVAYLTGDVESYYYGFMGIHTRAARLMEKIFPDSTDSDSGDTNKKKKGGIASWVKSWLNTKTHGLVDHIIAGMADMHGDGLYLSYMLALDEKEAFSDIGYTLLVVKGYEELAVFDSSRNQLARVIEGKISYKDMKFPAVLAPASNHKIIIGYPSVEDLDVLITDEALIPTPIDVVVEYYNSAGVFQGASTTSEIYTNRNRLYKFSVGKCLLEKESSEVQVSLLPKDKRKLEKLNLKPQPRFAITPEINYGSKNSLGIGVHVGTENLMMSLMTRPARIKFGEEGSFDIGIANQQTLYSSIKMENEIFGKFIWLDNDDQRFNFVPEWRTSLSIKALGPVHLFVAGTLDFKITDFNEPAFDSWIKEAFSFNVGDSLSLVPGIQFGLRF